MNKKTPKYLGGMSCRQDRKRRQKQEEFRRRPVKKTLSWLDEVLGAATPLPLVNGHETTYNRRIKNARWGTPRHTWLTSRHWERLMRRINFAP